MLPLIVALMLLALLVIRNLSNVKEHVKQQHISSSNKSETSSENSTTDTDTESLRLPRTIIPTKYNLTIIPYLEEAMNFTMDGNVRITIQCVETTNMIVLHAKNLTITESSVTLTDPLNLTPAVSVIDHAYDLDQDFYQITLSEPLRQYAFYELHIDFVALIGDDMAGFYQSSYVDKATNETR